jgi:hypothetical protein
MTADIFKTFVCSLFVIFFFVTCDRDIFVENSTDGNVTTEEDESSETDSSNDDLETDATFPIEGKTLLIIGQTFQGEYQDYVIATNLAPAGSSHYAELYTGAFNQGDDATNAVFLKWVSTEYPNAYAMLAVSIKDNTRAGGYGSLDPSSEDYSPNACYQALKDIVAGLWDNQIDSLAQELKSKPNMKFLFRLDYEVSIGLFANSSTRDWNDILDEYNSQGINILENPALSTEIDLTAYKDAYNYMANRIRNINGITNVDFVYHPVRGTSDTKALYPGSEYVDWIAFSVFNNDVCMDTLEASGSIPSNWCDATIDPNLASSLEWAKDQGKPIAIAESAFQTPSFGQKSENFEMFLDRLFNIIEEYDIHVLTYINSNWTEHAWSMPWGDSRVETEPEILDYWLNRVNTDRFIQYNMNQ